jgi:hypothetical protein
VHQVGFITRKYRDARSTKRKILTTNVCERRPTEANRVHLHANDFLVVLIFLSSRIHINPEPRTINIFSTYCLHSADHNQSDFNKF